MRKREGGSEIEGISVGTEIRERERRRRKKREKERREGETREVSREKVDRKYRQGRGKCTWIKGKDIVIKREIKNVKR